MIRFLMTLLTNYVITLELNYTVVLTLPQKEVVFHEKVKLECFINGTITNQTRQWIKGEPPFEETISVNGIITAKSDKCRYSEFVVIHNKTLMSFIFEIYNFSESDLNIFRCIFGKKEQGIQLNLNENFIYMPNGDYSVEAVSEVNSLEVVLNISKVYPKPVCIIYMKNRVINFSSSYIKLVNQFYAARFHKQFFISPDECGALVVTECQIGSRKVKLDQRKTFNCQHGQSWRIDVASLFIGSGACICLLCVVGLIVYSLKSQTRENQKKLCHHNDIMLQKIKDCNKDQLITAVNRTGYSGSLNSTVNVKHKETLLQNGIDDQCTDNGNEHLLVVQ